MISLLNSKIHSATVTGCRTDYVGSISLDTRLITGCGLNLNEKVLVANIDNGARLETYVIEGGAGVVELNGAAAKLAKEGDKVIIMSFGLFTEDEAKNHKPKIVFVDARNNILTN